MQPHTPDDYANQLRQFMPPGPAWRNPPDSPGDRDIQGEAQELARIDARAVYLCLYEFYAQSTRELLPEWEKEYGLPDPCTELGVTYEERIQNLLRKIRAIGGQSIAYLTSVAAALGIEITITEFQPFRSGMNRAGERLWGRKWRWVFLVTGPATRVYKFRSGRNAAGDRLRYWRRNLILECIINALKPAHTLALFGYRDYGTAFLGAEDNDEVFLRNHIEDGVFDDFHKIDPETGDIVLRGDIEPGAESVFMKVDEVTGDIVLKNELGEEF